MYRLAMTCIDFQHSNDGWTDEPQAPDVQCQRLAFEKFAETDTMATSSLELHCGNQLFISLWKHTQISIQHVI